MATVPLVEPQDSSAAAAVAAPVEPVTPEPTPATENAGAAALPPELIQLPAVQALLAGQPPALSADIASFANRPEGQLVAQNRDKLMKAGMGFYKSLGGDMGVLFNQFFIHPDEIKAADKAGNLLQIAPSFDDVNLQVGKSGQNNPILQEGERPTGFRQATIAQSGATEAPAQAQASVPPASSRIIGAKNRNMAAGSPTSGPKPGAGRLLNQIMKPVI